MISILSNKSINLISSLILVAILFINDGGTYSQVEDSSSGQTEIPRNDSYTVLNSTGTSQQDLGTEGNLENNGEPSQTLNFLEILTLNNKEAINPELNETSAGINGTAVVNSTVSNMTKAAVAACLGAPLTLLPLEDVKVSEGEISANSETQDEDEMENDDEKSSGEEDGSLKNDPFNMTVEEDVLLEPPAPRVMIVNISELTQSVLWTNSGIRSRSTPSNCSIVLFYTSWCPFSAKGAPHFNALPRAFPSLRVAAIDSSLHSPANSIFGILAVPTVLLFHNGKTIAKLNESSFTVHKLLEFVEAHTDLKSIENINVTSQDFIGPLSSVPSQSVDYALVLAWFWIVICFIYYATKSVLWRKAVDLVRTTWREAEDHVHQD